MLKLRLVLTTTSQPVGPGKEEVTDLYATDLSITSEEGMLSPVKVSETLATRHPEKQGNDCGGFIKTQHRLFLTKGKHLVSPIDQSMEKQLAAWYFSRTLLCFLFV